MMRSELRATVAVMALVIAGCGMHPGLTPSVSGLANPVGVAQPNVAQPQPGNNWVSFNGGFFSRRSVLQIAAGPDGNIWFTRYGPGSVSKISVGGSITEYFLPNQVTEPYGIVAGANNLLWFTESQAIASITTSGSITEFPTGGRTSPYALTWGADGSLWFTDNVTNSIGRMSLPGARVTEFAVPTARSGLNAIASGPDGALWFVETNAGKIGRISLTGSVSEFSLESGAAPMALITGPDHRIWFTDDSSSFASQGAVGAMTLSGSFVEYQIPGSSQLPGAIISGPGGLLWFGRMAGLGTVSPTGKMVLYKDGYIQFSVPLGLAQGSDANIWFGENADRIGVYVRLLMSANPSSLTFSSPSGSQTVTISEKRYYSTWTAASSNPSIATVMRGSKSSDFNVTAHSVGTCNIVISDNKGNSYTVPVTVN